MSPPRSALLLLLASSSWATHFYGGSMTFNPRGPNSDGSYMVEHRYKAGFHDCSASTWACDSVDCGNQTSLVVEIVDQTSGDFIWCQTEGVMTRNISNNTHSYNLINNGGNWIINDNSVVGWRLLTSVDLGVRSDTGKPNQSPQTTVIPLIRVPLNCQRDFQLFNFDPDGDEVRCRYAVPPECVTSSNMSLDFTKQLVSCTLSFSSVSNTTGTYAVQMVMEDFPTQSISLFYNDGTQSNRTSGDTLSKLPVQFAIRVDPAVPSCTEGEFLPMFQSPTPDQGAVLTASPDQPLEITVRAQATLSTLTELLMSGPQRITKNTTSPGLYLLKWTPTTAEEGGSYPVCFIAQGVNGSLLYQSEMRCVVITVGNQSAPTTSNPIITTNLPTTLTTDLPTTLTTGLPTTLTTDLPTTLTTGLPTTLTTGLPTTLTTGLPTTLTTDLPTTLTTGLPTTLTTDLTTTLPTPSTTITTLSSTSRHILVMRLKLSYLQPPTNFTTILPAISNLLFMYGLPADRYTLKLIATHDVSS